MKNRQCKNIFFLFFLMFSYQHTQASGHECSGVFSNSTETIESSPEHQVIQTTLSNLKTFNSRLNQDLKNKSSQLPAVILMDFLHREFNAIDEIYRNALVNDLDMILNEYNKSDNQIYDIITKLQKNLKPSSFKRIFSTTSKMSRTKDSLVDEIVNCRLGLHSCATTISKKVPDFERTYTLVKNLFSAYKNITEYLTSNHQQIIDILSQCEGSKDQAILFFEGKMNSLQSQLSVIKIKKDQLEQQYLHAVNIVKLKYPEINNQIKLLISLGAPQKIESAFQKAVVTAESEAAGKSYIDWVNSNQKLNLRQFNFEPNNYKLDLAIIEEQIKSLEVLTTRDLLYVLSIPVTKNDDYYEVNTGKDKNDLTLKERLDFQHLEVSYGFNITELYNPIYFFDRVLPIILDKWKPNYTQDEFELRNYIQNAIDEKFKLSTRSQDLRNSLKKLTNTILQIKLKELLENIPGVT